MGQRSSSARESLTKPWRAPSSPRALTMGLMIHVPVFHDTGQRAERPATVCGAGVTVLLAQAFSALITAVPRHIQGLRRPPELSSYRCSATGWRRISHRNLSINRCLQVGHHAGHQGHDHRYLLNHLGRGTLRCGAPRQFLNLVEHLLEDREERTPKAHPKGCFADEVPQ